MIERETRHEVTPAGGTTEGPLIPRSPRSNCTGGTAGQIAGGGRRWTHAAYRRACAQGAAQTRPSRGLPASSRLRTFEVKRNVMSDLLHWKSWESLREYVALGCLPGFIPELSRIFSYFTRFARIRSTSL